MVAAAWGCRWAAGKFQSMEVDVGPARRVQALGRLRQAGRQAGWQAESGADEAILLTCGMNEVGGLLCATAASSQFI